MGLEFAATAILDGFVRMYEGMDHWNPLTNRISSALPPEQREHMRSRFINHFGFDIVDYAKNPDKTLAKYVSICEQIQESF